MRRNKTPSIVLKDRIVDGDRITFIFDSISSDLRIKKINILKNEEIIIFELFVTSFPYARLQNSISVFSSNSEKFYFVVHGEGDIVKI